MERFEANGIWWLPDHKDDYVAGVLKFDPFIGATLEVVGRFNTTGMLLYTSIDLIYGFTASGDVTLHSAELKEEATGQTNRQEWLIGMIFMDAHLSEHELKFESVLVRFAYLEKWLNVSGVELNTEFGSREGTITFRELEVLATHVEDFDLSLRTRISYSVSNGKLGHLKEQAVFQANYLRKLDVTSWKSQFIDPLRRFLSFALDAATYPTQVTFQIDDPWKNSKDKKNITIYYRHAEIPGDALDANQVTPLFYFTDVAQTFERQLSLWFQKYDSLKDVFGLLYAAEQNPPNYVNIRFLLLVQALENYHRVIHQGSYLSKKVYRQRVLPKLKRAINELRWEEVWESIELENDEESVQLSEDIRKELVNRIKESVGFSYEFSLLKRIEQIFGSILSPYSSVMQTILENSESLRERIKDTRNYWTHYSNTPGSKAITDRFGLLDLAVRTKVVLELCIFLELEFPADVVNEIARRHRDFIRATKYKPQW